MIPSLGRLRRSRTEATLGLSLGPGRDIALDQETGRLRRNVLFVNTDKAWEDFRASSRELCAAFVLFRRRRCPACNHVAPKVWDASCDSHGMTEVAFVDVDVEDCPETVRDLKIDIAPTYQIYAHGRLKGTYTGVSISELTDRIDAMYSLASTCKPCLNKLHLASSVLQRVIFEHVLCKMTYPDVTDTICASAYLRIPLGLSRVHFDFDSQLLQSPVIRAAELSRRLSEGPSLSETLHGDISEFLADVQDAELHVEDIWAFVHRWLSSKWGHASRWTIGNGQACQRLVHVALARRSARAELWLLLSLAEIQAPSRILARLTTELRREFGDKLRELRVLGRGCLARCSHCALSCTAGPHGHEGAHDCLTDHRCHRAAPGADADGLQCLREAGHLNSCLFQQPVLPLAPADNLNPILPISLTDIFAPLTALVPLEASLTNSDTSICAICLDPLSGRGSCVALPCAHSFHRVCTVEWLVRKPFCPLCRQRVVGTEAPTAPLNVMAYSIISSLPRVREGSNAVDSQEAPAASEEEVYGEPSPADLPQSNAVDVESPAVASSSASPGRRRINATPKSLTRQRTSTSSLGFRPARSGTRQSRRQPPL